MLSKKYTVALVIAFLCSGLCAEESSTSGEQQPRVIHITQCNKIDFGLTINQTDASPEEREIALQIISDFCNTEVTALSEKLKQEAPHVNINLVLLNIEEDALEDILDNAIVDDSLDNTIEDKDIAVL